MPESTHPLRPVLRTSLRAALRTASSAAAIRVAVGCVIGLGLLGAPASALAQHGQDPHWPASAAEQIADQGEHEAPHDDHAADPSAHFNWVDFGYGSKNIYGGPLQPGDEPMSPPFVMMIFNFGVVVALLMWKARPAILKYTAKRHDTIKAALEEAGGLREQARAKLDEYTAQLARAEKEIDQMVADIRQGAEAEKQRILAEAEAQAEALKRDAEQRIKAEIERARAGLEREVVAAAIAVAERLIREQATKSDFMQLADGFIQDIQSQADSEPAAHS